MNVGKKEPLEMELQIPAEQLKGIEAGGSLILKFSEPVEIPVGKQRRPGPFGQAKQVAVDVFRLGV